MDFSVAVDRLLNQVGHWEQPRWAGRAEPVYELVQRLADLGADAEGRDRRPVPREGNLVLPHQVRVMADDLVAADPSPDVLETATALVNAVRQSL